MNIKAGSNGNTRKGYEVTLQKGDEIRTNNVLANSIEQIIGPVTRAYARNGWTVISVAEVSVQVVDGVAVKVGA